MRPLSGRRTFAHAVSCSGVGARISNTLRQRVHRVSMEDDERVLLSEKERRTGSKHKNSGTHRVDRCVSSLIGFSEKSRAWSSCEPLMLFVSRLIL